MNFTGTFVEHNQAEAVAAVKAQKRRLIEEFARPDGGKRFCQIATTLVPLALLWIVAILGAPLSPAVPVVATMGMAFILVRTFVLMHECGHESLFRTPATNRNVGFALGVICGMPQYVWARNHSFHHTTNGNWARYRGPLATASVDEYEALTPRQQRRYARSRSIFLAPLGGFMYLVVNPRLNWLRGLGGLAAHLVKRKWAVRQVSLREHARQFKTSRWQTSAEFRHMSMNNLVLLGAWAGMCWLVGPLLFFPIYCVSIALAGGAAIALFAVQHNFEHSYASSDQGWDYDAAALHGSSFLELPAWLNWSTASIGYHHIHHLSSRIPNHRLVACHARHVKLFASVPRLRLADVGASLKFILWDKASRRIISVAEYEAGRSARLRASPGISQRPLGLPVRLQP